MNWVINLYQDLLRISLTPNFFFHDHYVERNLSKATGTYPGKIEADGAKSIFREVYQKTQNQCVCKMQTIPYMMALTNKEF
jgi:hypothetical protein